jgi:hypothetical protein
MHSSIDLAKNNVFLFKTASSTLANSFPPSDKKQIIIQKCGIFDRLPA